MRISGHFNAMKHNYMYTWYNSAWQTEIVKGRFYQQLDTAVDNKGKHYTILVSPTHTKVSLVFIEVTWSAS